MVEFRVYYGGDLSDIRYVTFDEMKEIALEYVNRNIYFTAHKDTMPLFTVHLDEKPVEF